MTNERLRAALLERGMTIAALAEAIGVDEKTIERWVTQGRTPYRRHRYAAASNLGVDETYIWPDAISREQVATASESEIVNVYPHRWAMPRDIWGRLFSQAEEEIDILVYVALFLVEDTGVQRLFAEKARAGVRFRVLLGQPDCAAVAQRGEEEGIGDAIAAKVRNAIALYRPLRQARRRGVPPPRHRPVQLDLPRRRRHAGQHPRLRQRRVERPGPPPAQRRRRRHGQPLS